MSGWLIPPGDRLRNAISFILEERERSPQRPLAMIVSDAGVAFDLTPSEEEWLTNLLIGPREAPAAR
jgi:hypothetical protein